MKKLKFKIITYENIDYEIKENINTYESYFDDNIKLIDILNKLNEKFNKNNKNPRMIILGLNSILWSEYFNMFDIKRGLLDERIIMDYYGYKIGELCNQFNIENRELEVLLDPPFGGDVGRHRGIHYFFHTSEKDIHHRPHIHIKSGGVEFRVALDNIEVLDKKVFKNPQKNKLAINMIKKNQLELLNYWNKVVINGENIPFKMYFPSR